MSSRQIHLGMTTYLLATNSLPVSETLCEHIHGELDESDTVHAVNSQVGGTDTDADDIQTGESALRTVETRLGDAATVETRLGDEGNAPAEDVLETADEVDADQLVVSIRDRSRTSRLVFESVVEDILLTADIPMRVVPRAN
jgi:Universal stress protein family.